MRLRNTNSGQTHPKASSYRVDGDLQLEQWTLQMSQNWIGAYKSQKEEIFGQNSCPGEKRDAILMSLGRPLWQTEEELEEILDSFDGPQDRSMKERLPQRLWFALGHKRCPWENRWGQLLTSRLRGQFAGHSPAVSEAYHSTRTRCSSL